jgi:hypothetical protein
MPRSATRRSTANAIIAEVDARGAKVVIAQHPRRTKPPAIDIEMYEWRHLIENFFCKLKKFKRIAMGRRGSVRVRPRSRFNSSSIRAGMSRARAQGADRSCAPPTAAIIDSQSVKSAKKGGARLIRRTMTRGGGSKARNGISWSTRKPSCASSW